MKTHVDADDARPAGRQGECFYCQKKVGEEHTFTCCIPEKRVRLRVIMEYETYVPRSWNEGNILFHRNEGTYCIGNAAGEIQKFIDEKEDECRVCQTAKVEFVGFVEEPMYKETP